MMECFGIKNGFLALTSAKHVFLTKYSYFILLSNVFAKVIGMVYHAVNAVANLKKENGLMAV